MANDILITPGGASIEFSGSAANTIRLQVESSGSVAFYGNSGSLFSIADSLSGSLMSVNDISGIPILEVFSDDRVVMGTFNSNALVVTGSKVGIGTAIPANQLQVAGNVSASSYTSSISNGVGFFGTASYALSASGTGGTNGSSGSSGTSGNNGAPGSSGSSGTSGTRGSSGSSGSSGNSGAPGSSGSSGTSGNNGAPGSSGSSGTSGTRGSSGSSGSSGAGTISGGVANRVAYFSGATSLTGNANLTYDTTTLYVNGALGVGTNTPTTTGLIRATNDIVAFYSSDERLKDNKKPISNALDKIRFITGYEFDWIPKEGIHENEGHDIGVIAQEVIKVIPEIVTTRDNGYLAVRYEKIVPLLIQAIKEQQIQIDELKQLLGK